MKMKNSTSSSSSVANGNNKITSPTTSTLIGVVVAIAIFTIIFISSSSLFLSNDIMAFAFDVVKDDSIQVNGNARFPAGGSTIMGYWIQQIGKNCDPTQSPTTVNINVPSSEVSATPNSLTFGTCSKPQSVTFTSSKPGTYSITATAPVGYKTSSAAFTL
jgi:hypothetical protein